MASCADTVTGTTSTALDCAVVAKLAIPAHNAIQQDQNRRTNDVHLVLAEYLRFWHQGIQHQAF